MATIWEEEIQFLHLLQALKRCLLAFWWSLQNSSFIMRIPILLTKEKLIEPIIQALDRLEKIREPIALNVEEIIFEGLFVLAVATFENSLNDTIKVLLTQIPEKLDTKFENISKEDLIYGDPLEKWIEVKINSVSYKNLKEIIDYFIKTTGINENTISELLIDKLQEIKATRNLLLHNNLTINNIYNETAGKLKREGIKNKLKVNQKYLYITLTTLTEILLGIKTQLSEKYSEYTHLKALRELWKYTFKTPIMNFENEWIVNLEKDAVVGHNEAKSKRKDLSSSEQILYTIWYSHLHSGPFNFENLNFYNLDKYSREKVAFLLNKIDLLKSRG